MPNPDSIDSTDREQRGASDPSSGRMRLPMKHGREQRPLEPLGELPIRLRRHEPPPPAPPDWRRVLPIPLRLPLAHAALSLGILTCLPQRALSIPVAVGLAAAILYYIQYFAYRSGYRLGP